MSDRRQIFEDTLAQANGWTTESVAAELRDMSETLAYLQADHARNVADLEKKTATVVSFHGEDEAHWPGSSWHMIKELRERVQRSDESLCAIPPIIDAYTKVLADRVYG